MKKSKLQRKYLNSMRGMGDIPWPARRFKYPPTSARLASRQIPVGTCERKIGETKVKQGRLKRAQSVDVPCGGRLIAKLGKLGKRRVYCEACRDRDRRRKFMLRLEQQARRFGIAPEVAVREERRSTRMLNKFRRSGVR
jgi:hypothetical protein